MIPPVAPLAVRRGGRVRESPLPTLRARCRCGSAASGGTHGHGFMSAAARAIVSGPVRNGRRSSDGGHRISGIRRRTCRRGSVAGRPAAGRRARHRGRGPAHRGRVGISAGALGPRRGARGGGRSLRKRSRLHPRPARRTRRRAVPERNQCRQCRDDRSARPLDGSTFRRGERRDPYFKSMYRTGTRRWPSMSTAA